MIGEYLESLECGGGDFLFLNKALLPLDITWVSQQVPLHLVRSSLITLLLQSIS